MEVTLETIILNFIQWIADLSNNLFTKVFPEDSIISQISSGANDGITFILDLLIKVNFLVPVPTIMILIGVSMVIEVIYFQIFIGNWILRRIFDIIP